VKNIYNLINLISRKELKNENEKMKELIKIFSDEYLIPYDIKKILDTSFESENLVNNSNENVLVPHIEQRDETNINDNNIIEYSKAEQALERMKIIIQIYPEKKNDRNFEYKEILIGKNEQKLKNDDELKIHADYDSISEIDDLADKIKVEKGKIELVYKNYKKLAAFFKDVENSINDLEIKFNPRISLELERELREINKEGDDPHNEYKDLYNITCISTFDNQLDHTTMKCKDQNILVYSINGRTPGFLYLSNELTNDDYEDAVFKYDD
jgi:hypothetical protein